MSRESGGIVGEAQSKKLWVTLKGLPLTIKLDWPFHLSTSGADFWVLHGDIALEGSDGLHAPVAVNLSMDIRESYRRRHGGIHRTESVLAGEA